MNATTTQQQSVGRTAARWETSLDAGVVILVTPHPLTERDERDLIEWLQFIAKTLKKRKKRRDSAVDGGHDKPSEVAVPSKP